MPPIRFKATRRRVAIIDAVLRSEGKHTLESISGRLGVTVRTTCRDLAFMKQKMGLPVAHDPQRGYYYALPVAPIDQPSRTMSSPLKTGPASGGLPMDVVRRNLEVIHEALYEGRRLILTQGSGDEVTEEFGVRPFFLSRLKGDLYLFAARIESDVLVNLPISTIRRAEAGTHLEGPSPFGADKVRAAGGWVRSGIRYRVSLRFKRQPDWVRDLQICEDQRVESTPRGLFVRFDTDDLENVRALVRLLGRWVKVEEPSALRSAEGKMHAIAGSFFI